MVFSVACSLSAYFFLLSLLFSLLPIPLFCSLLSFLSTSLSFSLCFSLYPLYFLSLSLLLTLSPLFSLSPSLSSSLFFPLSPALTLPPSLIASLLSGITCYLNRGRDLWPGPHLGSTACLCLRFNWLIKRELEAIANVSSWLRCDLRQYGRQSFCFQCWWGTVGASAQTPTITLPAWPMSQSAGGWDAWTNRTA